jgi:hypothetical protein
LVVFARFSFLLVSQATAEELRKYGLAGKTSITAGRSNLGMRGDDDE